MSGKASSDFGIRFVERISEGKLGRIWKKFSDRPLPNVRAFIVEDKEFLSALTKLQKCPSFVDGRVEEYGVACRNDVIDACTFQVLDVIVILVRQAAVFSLNEKLEHELRHILRGHLSLGAAINQDEDEHGSC